MESFYNYIPLSHSRHTRVLKILPSSDKAAPICFLLQEMPVDNPRYYEALSYTWAGQAMDRPVQCSGATLLITANAESAIRRLRNRFTARYLWIDSICIDQSSTLEKSSQVMMMAEIYGKAKRTLVWLGLGTKEMQAALSYIRTKQSIVEPTTSTGYLGESRIRALEMSTSNVPVVSGFPEDTTWLQNWSMKYQKSQVMKYDARSNIRQGLQEIANHPYWTRLWTVQEMALSRTHRVYCGDSHYVSGNQLRDIVVRTLLLLNEPWDPMMPFNLQVDNPLFGNPLSIMAYKQASVPHDLVYGIRSLFPNSLGLVPVDYGRDLLELYVEVTKIFINTSDSMEVLQLACHGEKPLGWPSWVPNFSSPDIGKNVSWRNVYQYYGKQGSRYHAVRYSDDNKALFIPGVEIAAISDNISEDFPLSTWSWLSADGWKGTQYGRYEQDFTTRHRLLQQFIAATRHRDDHESIVESLFEFIFKSYLEITNDSPVLRAWVSSLVTGGAFQNTDATISLQYRAQFGYLTSKKRFFVTTDGRVGVSGGVQIGDTILLLSSSLDPFVLRHHPPNTHKLISPAKIESFQEESKRLADGTLLVEFCLI
ncbi:heterokaryon incompatibility protein-domain-containing protein [Xylaria telfairii]|nr:heterokaryon incompatibility protein-domain-containing protein [Xylaria telfairii]